MCVAKGRTQHSCRLCRAGREKRTLSITLSKASLIDKPIGLTGVSAQGTVDNREQTAAFVLYYLFFI